MQRGCSEHTERRLWLAAVMLLPFPCSQHYYIYGEDDESGLPTVYSGDTWTIQCRCETRPRAELAPPLSGVGDRDTDSRAGAGWVLYPLPMTYQSSSSKRWRWRRRRHARSPPPPAAIHNFRRNPSPLARSLASVDPQDKICSDPLSLYPSDDLLPPSASSIPSPQPQSSAAASE